MNFITSLLHQAAALPVSGQLGVLLYWAPASLCSLGYTLRTFRNYQQDVAKRAKAEKDKTYYVPTDTIGSLVGRAIVTVLPVANVWAALFDVAPTLFGRVFTYLNQALSQPLVPGRLK